jgi:protein-tyrosine phosphatase
MDRVFNHIYISDWYSSNDPYLLYKNNIKAVLTIETRNKDNDIINYYKNKGIDFLYLYLHDSANENIDKYFDLSYDFIDKHVRKGENVLVHCYAGISRSTTLVLNYLLRKAYSYNENKNIKPTYMLDYFINLVRQNRPRIKPNPGFINQLENRSYYYYKFKK